MTGNRKSAGTLTDSYEAGSTVAGWNFREKKIDVFMASCVTYHPIRVPVIFSCVKVMICGVLRGGAI